MKTVLIAAITSIAATGVSIAQDWSQSPNFGSASLSAGFAPDPYNVDIVAGGSVDASNVGCAGMIANAPDYRLHWSGGQITIGATSGSDTTLVVNAPDGNWYCSDDANGFDPELVLNGSGQYDIWVGTYGGGTANARLYFTEF
ncbi:peptidase S1 [Maricaulis sp.]|uniref:peptidase S1 n=1 Tax=Maricaulis sp. TaxID=1486257 RepID=UPI00262BF569|nr:peptidase S1 [Maricaulis sp.]